MKGKIYKIYNDVNDKLYIGKTVSSIEKRFQEHCYDSKKERCEKRPLYNAMNKYGIEHFFIELIEECDLKELSEKEIYWIGYYNSYKNGYNATLGGDGKILYDYDLIVQLYQNGLTGKEIANQLVCDIDTVRKALLSAGLNPNDNMIKLLSKKVEMHDKETNELLKIFDSQMDAGRWLKENNKTEDKKLSRVSGRIGDVCNGKRKTAYGYKWKRI